MERAPAVPPPAAAGRCAAAVRRPRAAVACRCCATCRCGGGRRGGSVREALDPSDSEARRFGVEARDSRARANPAVCRPSRQHGLGSSRARAGSALVPGAPLCRPGSNLRMAGLSARSGATSQDRAKTDSDSIHAPNLSLVPCAASGLIGLDPLLARQLHRSARSGRRFCGVVSHRPRALAAHTIEVGGWGRGRGAADEIESGAPPCQCFHPALGRAKRPPPAPGRG